MVAHNAADVSFLFAAMVRRRTFFQEDHPTVSHGVAVRRATQQSRGGARLRDGSSDRYGGCLELREEWKRHSADKIAVVHQNQVLEESTHVFTSMVVCREATAEHSRQKLLRWC